MCRNCTSSLQSSQKTSLCQLVGRSGNLPIFAGRSILVAREIAVPFHKNYYAQIRQRAIDLINAQYSSDRKS